MTAHLLALQQIFTPYARPVQGIEYRLSRNSHLAGEADIYQIAIQANTYLREVTRTSRGMHKAFDGPLTTSLGVRGSDKCRSWKDGYETTRGMWGARKSIPGRKNRNISSPYVPLTISSI